MHSPNSFPTAACHASFSDGSCTSSSSVIQHNRGTDKKLSMDNVVNPSGETGLAQNDAGIMENARWISTATICDRGDSVQTEADGYVTAHTSVISLMPECVTNKGGRPRSLADTSFVSISSSAQRLPEVAILGVEDASTPSSQQSIGELCRICHGENTPEAPLIAPCSCSGSMKYVHQECIQIWLKSSGTLSCELCRFTYLTGTKSEPLRRWKRLELTLLERWKIVCCVMIQLFAICYFILSAEALARAIKDFHVPQAAMWLWIKITMSIFGISVSVACTIRQCKTFFRLFRRWQMYNKAVFVKDRSENAETPSATRALLGGNK